MAALPDQFQLDDLHVDLGQQRVTRGGVHLQLPKLSFDVLVALAKAAPKLVSIDELMSEVWPGLIVNPETVGQRIKLLRNALGDDPRTPRYIESLRSRGYRLLPLVAADARGPIAAPPTAAAPPPIPQRAPPVWSNRRRAMVALTVAGLAIATLLTIRALWLRNPVPAPPSTPAKISAADLVLPPRTVAVLPFAIIGSDPRDALLASGIAESIRLRLGTLSQIVVIEGTSTTAYSGRNVNAATVGRELNARYLLEGTLQRQENSLRITARLVDAQEAQDVWSVLFDRKAADIFSVQDEISTKIARALNVTLDAGDEQRRRSSGTNNLDAYLEFLEGHSLLIKQKSEDIRAAIGHFRRATELDPKYSAAYSGLALSLLYSNIYDEVHLSDARRKSVEAEARKMNDKGLELDPRNAGGYVVLVLLENDPAKKEIYLKRALALEPNSAFAHSLFAELSDKTAADTPPTFFDERIFHLSKAMEIDPLNPGYPMLLASEYFLHRTSEIDRIEPLLLRSLELDPNYRESRQMLAFLRLCCQRRQADGIKIMEQLVAEEPSVFYRDILVFQYASMGDFAAADDVVADSEYKSSHIITLSARHQWHEALLVFAKHDAYSGFALFDYGFALRMDAHQSGNYAAARTYFEDNADIKWDKNGTPVVGIPMGSQLGAEIALADILQKTGEAQRARKILEASLNVLETAAVKFKRGYDWLRYPRVQALALLGRDVEALDALGQVPRGAGWYYDWRQQFAVDPIFYGIRHDPRFVAFLEESERYDAAQRALLQKMRDNGEIPKRPGHKVAQAR